MIGRERWIERDGQRERERERERETVKRWRDAQAYTLIGAPWLQCRWERLHSVTSESLNPDLHHHSISLVTTVFPPLTRSSPLSSPSLASSPLPSPVLFSLSTLFCLSSPPSSLSHTLTHVYTPTQRHTQTLTLSCGS